MDENDDVVGPSTKKQKFPPQIGTTTTEGGPKSQSRKNLARTQSRKIKNRKHQSNNELMDNKLITNYFNFKLEGTKSHGRLENCL